MLFLPRECKEIAQSAAALRGRSSGISRKLFGESAVLVGQNVIVIFHQRRAQIHRRAGLAKIVGKAGKDTVFGFFLDAFERLVIALMPAIHDQPNTIRFYAEAG